MERKKTMKVPIARSISWIGVTVAVIPLLALVCVNMWLESVWLPIVGALVWMVITTLMRRLLTGAHRKAMHLIKHERFEEAKPLFAQSYAVLCQRPWIDKFRWLLLGGCSRLSYREMALCNLAFCYGQTGDGQKMKEYYEKALAEFPGSVIATTALRFIDSLNRPESANQPVQP